MLAWKVRVRVTGRREKSSSVGSESTLGINEGEGAVKGLGTPSPVKQKWNKSMGDQEGVHSDG